MTKIDMDFRSLQILQNLGLFLPNEMTKTLEKIKKAEVFLDILTEKLFLLQKIKI